MSIGELVRVPLAGLELGLMPEATRGRTRWLRKAPLKLSFPGASPPYGQVAFVMFASNAAEKEQWFFALGWGAAVPATTATERSLAEQLAAPATLPPEHAPEKDSLQTWGLYQEFSAYMRRIAPVMLPVMLPPPPPAAVAAAADAAADPPRRRWWATTRGRNHRQLAASLNARNARSMPTTTEGTQVVHDFIGDKQWGSSPARTATVRIKPRPHVRSSSSQSVNSGPRALGTSPPPGSPGVPLPGASHLPCVTVSRPRKRELSWHAGLSADMMSLPDPDAPVPSAAGELQQEGRRGSASGHSAASGASAAGDDDALASSTCLPLSARMHVAHAALRYAIVLLQVQRL